MTSQARCTSIYLLTLVLYAATVYANDDIVLRYQSLDTVATYRVGTADSLPFVMQHLPDGRNPEIMIWLTDKVYSRHLTTGLLGCRNIWGLTLNWVDVKLVDSVLAIVDLPKLELIAISYNHTRSVPNHLSRFPALTTLALQAIDDTFPCINPDSVPNLETIYVYDTLRYTTCICIRQRQVVVGRSANAEPGFDYDRLFILTGVYTDSSSVYDLFAVLDAPRFNDTIPMIGVRQYSVRVLGQGRTQISEGIVDRILAVLIAHTKRDEWVFDGEREATNKRFLEVVADRSNDISIEFDIDRVVINGVFIYRGRHMSLINQLVSQGCL